jgi:hypothetical protein
MNKIINKHPYSEYEHSLVKSDADVKLQFVSYLQCLDKIALYRDAENFFAG